MFFTFRHYDVIKDESAKYYSFIFSASSLWTSFFIGVLAGAIKLGWIDLTSKGFYDAYINPWLNLFSISVGLFTCCVFAFLAAVYLFGENSNKLIERYLFIQARNANIAIVASGFLVFIAAEYNGLKLLESFENSFLSTLAIAIATLSVPVLWLCLIKRRVGLSRLVAGSQIFIILFAWFWLNFPTIIRIENAPDVTIYNSIAPPSTIDALGRALIIGGLLILPAFFYLLETFKHQKKE